MPYSSSTYPCTNSQAKTAVKGGCGGTTSNTACTQTITVPTIPPKPTLKLTDVIPPTLLYALEVVASYKK